MEPDLSRERARRNIVRPTECRKEVIQRQLVGHVDTGGGQTPFVMVAFEQVVIAGRNVEQVARGDSGRIVVVVFGIDCWNLNKTLPELRCQAGRGQRSRRRGADSIASETGFELLIGAERVSEAVRSEERRVGKEGRSRGSP